MRIVRGDTEDSAHLETLGHQIGARSQELQLYLLNLWLSNGSPKIICRIPNSL